MCPGSAAAQDLFGDAGFATTHGTYSTLPYEHVDPLSGNLIVLVTDLALPGNAGLDLRITRSYNSKFHRDFERGDGAIDERTPVGVGWRLHFGRVRQADSLASGTTVIETPDGGGEALYRTSAFTEGWISKGFWRYNRATHSALAPNGLVYVFGHVGEVGGPRGTVRYVTQIRDPFNNRLEFEYAPGGLPGAVSRVRQHLSPTQVREVFFHYRADGALDRTEYDGREWRYEYEPAPGAPGHLVLRRVVPPAGLPWGYEYANTGAGPELSALLVPGGGRINYTYGTATRRAGALSQPSRVVSSRRTEGHRITGGTWTFNYSQGANQDQTVVACPCGTQTYRFAGIGLAGDFEAWRSGLLVERQIEENGSLLERETSIYEQSEAVSTDPILGEQGVWSDPAVYKPLLKERRLTRGAQSWTTTLEYRRALGTFSDYGRPWRVVRSGELTAVTERTFLYGFGPWIVDRVESENLKIGPEIVASSWTYDLATGFLTESREYGNRLRYEPSATGNVAAVTDANNHRTTFTYQWGALAQAVSPLLTTTRTIGSAGEVTDETVGTLTTRYGYDLAFRPTFVRPPGYPNHASEIRYEYDGLYQEWVRIARGTAQTSLELDGFGRVVSTANRVGLRTTTQRDACGRATFQSAPYTSGSGDRGVTSEYDALGRVRKATTADGKVAEYFYTGIDVDVVDPENRRTKYDYSAFGGPDDARLTRVADARSSNTNYRYDVLGNLIEVRGPGTGVVRTWSYDSRGLPLWDVQPESGRTDYVHDPAGRLTTITDASGHQTLLSYDDNDRLTSRNAHGTDGDATYRYDSLGRLDRVTSQWVTTTYAYHPNTGRIASRTDVVDGMTLTSSYGYDLHDNLTTIQYPRWPSGGRTVTYVYNDPEYRLTEVQTTVQQTSQRFAHDFRYDESGRLQSYVTGTVTHRIEYDAQDRTKRLTAGPSGAAALDLTYNYFPAGAVQNIQDGRPGMSQSFLYDELYRLREAGGPYGTQTWSYDAAGNRRSEGTPGGTTAYQYDDARQRLISTTGTNAEIFSYDNLGQLTGDSRGTYTYTGGGLLRSATKAPSLAAAHAYDGADQRILHTVNDYSTYTFRSAGGQVLAEHERQCGTLRWKRDLIYAGDRLLGAVRADVLTPTATFLLTASTTGEGAGIVRPLVRLTTPDDWPIPCAVSVRFETRPGTAAAGNDFAPTTGTVTFPVDTASGTDRYINPAIGLVDDGMDEPDESFTVALTGGTGVAIGEAATHVVTIQDNDAPPSLTLHDLTVNEAAGTAAFTIALSQPSALPIAINYGTGDSSARPGLDYVGAAGSVGIPPLTASYTIPITLIDDTHAEPSESFALHLWNPVNATIADSMGLATIIDNERPRAPIDPSLPGNFFALGTAFPTYPDYIAIGNRHGVAVPARVTYTRADGSGVSHDFDVPASGRVTVRPQDDARLGTEDVAIAVQSRDPQRPLDAEHSVYTTWSGWQSGRSTEGVTPSPTWYFAEGSVGYFEEVFAIFNPSNGPIDVTATYYGTEGYIGQSTHHIEPGPGWTKYWARDVIGPRDHATKFEARATLTGAPAPIVVERAMNWQAGGAFQDENSSPGVTAPQPNWYFAEGDTGMATYLLVLNPNPTPETVEVEFLLEDTRVFRVSASAPALGRVTVAPPPWLPAGSFGMRIRTWSGASIVAERSMYGGADWTFGHTGVGKSAPSNHWAFSEGSTGSFWTTYFLLANPSSSVAHVYLRHRKTDGTYVEHYVGLPGRTRRTVLINAVPGMASAEFSTEVFSVGIPATEFVVERATYWPGGLSAMAAASTESDEQASAANDTGAHGAAVAVTPYGQPRSRTKLPNFYHHVIEGVPAGPAEEALAAVFRAEEARKAMGGPPGTDSSGSPPEATTQSSSGGWYGAHLSGGRRP